MEQTERQLVSLLSEITPLYDVPMREAKARQDALAKPPGSLGLLEDLSVQLAGITGQVKNEVSHTRIYVLAADNGVVCEGVSSAPQSVTRAQAINLTRGLTGASCLAKHFGDELVVADMGIALPYACPEILNRSLGKGTANIAVGPAMARQTAVRGILPGMGLAAGKAVASDACKIFACIVKFIAVKSVFGDLQRIVMAEFFIVEGIGNRIFGVHIILIIPVYTRGCDAAGNQNPLHGRQPVGNVTVNFDLIAAACSDICVIDKLLPASRPPDQCGRDLRIDLL